MDSGVAVTHSGFVIEHSGFAVVEKTKKAQSRKAKYMITTSVDMNEH